MTTLFQAGKLTGHLPGLLLEAERVAQSLARGAHGRRRVGTGEAFWQFRPYQAGDASRDIDWRQTGKRDDVFVRQTEWEASQTVWLYRDASQSMDFSSAATLLTKKDYAEVLLLALGMVLLNGGERVGLLGADLAPQTGYPSIQRLYDKLGSQTHMVEGSRPVTARSHVILISDFYFPLTDVLVLCESLASRGVAGTLVQVFDPVEESLPYNGRIRFQDMEGASAPLDIASVESIREEYVQKFLAHQKSLSAMAGGMGWKFQSFSTAIKPEEAIARLYDDLAVKK